MVPSDHNVASLFDSMILSLLPTVLLFVFDNKKVERCYQILSHQRKKILLLMRRDMRQNTSEIQRNLLFSTGRPCN